MTLSWGTVGSVLSVASVGVLLWLFTKDWWKGWHRPSPADFGGTWYPRSAAPAVDALVGYDRAHDAVALCWPNGDMQVIGRAAAEQLSALLYIATLDAQGAPLDASRR